MSTISTGEDAALHSTGSLSPSADHVVNELQGLSFEEQEIQKAEWNAELAKVEEEIQTLRHVLASKVRVSQELKRKLGISVWRELTDDMNQGLRNVKESQVFVHGKDWKKWVSENMFLEQFEKSKLLDVPFNVRTTFNWYNAKSCVVVANNYQNVEAKLGQITKAVSESNLFQKTESVFKTTAEKTTSILGGFGSGLSMKLGQMRNSDSFRSLEERVGSAYENVKTKVVPSRSNSTQSFDETLRESEATRRASAAPSATSPTIPEDKPLS